MRRPEFIARQASCPTGFLGRVLAWVMAAETASANEKALELLTLKPGERVLEVGFGHGRTVARAAALVPGGYVAGVDVSEKMLRMAGYYNRRLIKEGQVELKLADSSRLPYPDECFDKVYAIHTLYFWADPQQHLREIARVMKMGARLVVGFGPKEDKRVVANFPATVYRFYTSDEVRFLLEEIGFTEVRMVNQRVSSRNLAFAVVQRRA